MCVCVVCVCACTTKMMNHLIGFVEIFSAIQWKRSTAGSNLKKPTCIET